MQTPVGPGRDHDGSLYGKCERSINLAIDLATGFLYTPPLANPPPLRDDGP
jgi:hypothetical protein